MRCIVVSLVRLVVLVSIAFAVSAKDSVVVETRVSLKRSPWSFAADYGLASHSAVFSQMSGVETCCSDYRASNGAGASLLASYMLNSFESSVGVSVHAGVSLLTAPMSTVTREVVDYRGSAYTAEIRHDLTMSYWQALIGVSGSYEMLPWLNVNVGLTGCVPVMLGYETSETLLSPQGLIYETGTAVRNVTTGTSPAAKASVLIPIALEGPKWFIGKTVAIQPRIGFLPWITGINSAADWTVSAITAGVRMNLFERSESLDTQLVSVEPPLQETAPVKVPNIQPQQLRIRAGVRDPKINEYLSRVRMAYNVKRRRLAILPSVFFDSAQADIPKRFMAKKVLDVEELAESVSDIDVSHSVLHVIGATLHQQPSAVVIITGSHAEDGPSELRQQLANDRANAVKLYLMESYGIDPKRIRTKARAFPERASAASTPYARAENRRADFELSYGELNLPVQPDTFAVVTPEYIETAVEVSRPESLQRLRISVFADGELVTMLDTAAGSKQITVALPLDEALKNALVVSKVVEVEVAATDALDGVVKQRVKAFDVVAEQGEDAPLDEYGIVLFDYSSSRISDSERPVIEELRKRLINAQRIIITGTSDESGIESVNRRLAEERALSVARELRLKPGSYELHSRIATDYSSIVPEGRMLGRQVRVVFQNAK